MEGRIQRGNHAGEYRHVLTTQNGEIPLELGTSIKAKIHDDWWRGRYEYDLNDGRLEAVLNAGDVKYYIPEGTEVELVEEKKP